MIWLNPWLKRGDHSGVRLPFFSTTEERAKIRDRGTEPPPTGRRLPHHF
jgi:hypothetical protein